MALRATLLAAALAASFGGGAGAQSNTETLADIRQQLSVLYVELQRLNRELSTTGNPSVALGGATGLERMQRIEAELARLTSRTEDLSLRITNIVKDGTNRVGDLEFRLCELEPACDIATLGATPSLGGELPPEIDVTPVAPDTGVGSTPELALSEQRDFDAAQAALQAGEYAQAAGLFQTFTDTYPGGPLNAEAHYLRGEALAAQGNMADAGRAYLESFSGSPNGPRAPDALLQLGVALEALGQRDEACVMLGQLGARFPGQPQVATADLQMQRIGC